MKRTMEKYNNEGKSDYTQNNFNILPYVNKIKYHPMTIYSFSPFPEYNYLHDIVSAASDVRGLIEIIEPTRKIKINEAEEIMKKKYDEVTNSGETGKLYLFSLPTAIGKTELLTDNMSTIALPTYDLKNEISRRITMDHLMTPDPIGFDDEYINTKLQYYFIIGLPTKAMGII